MCEGPRLMDVFLSSSPTSDIGAGSRAVHPASRDLSLWPPTTSCASPDFSPLQVYPMCITVQSTQCVFSASVIYMSQSALSVSLTQPLLVHIGWPIILRAAYRTAYHTADICLPTSKESSLIYFLNQTWCPVGRKADGKDPSVCLYFNEFRMNFNEFRAGTWALTWHQWWPEARHCAQMPSSCGCEWHRCTHTWICIYTDIRIGKSFCLHIPRSSSS